MAIVSANRALLLIFGLVLVFVQDAAPACVFHPSYKGDWYSREAGYDLYTSVSEKKWGDYECVERMNHVLESDGVEGLNTTMVLKDTQSSTKCYICMDVLWRTKNILQYRKTGCLSTLSKLKDVCTGYYKLPGINQVSTLFRRVLEKVNCISTLEGTYQFSYEIDKAICDNSGSIIEACQNPGSAYVDNMVFLMTFSICKGIQTSKSDTVRFQCMGSWYARNSDGSGGSTFAAIADTVEKDNREKYKCLVTSKDQKNENNELLWGMSRFADCLALDTWDKSPVKLVLKKVAPRISYTSSQCNLPRNISGDWFTQGREFTSHVYINDTHIHYRTQKNAFEFEDTYLSCQQSLGTRYLMTKYIQGKCEVDFVCYDIMPRHHGIVRYRSGKPSRLTLSELKKPGDMTKKFREVCSWTSFTFNRNDTDWKYHVLILDPPSPVTCPLGGRYKFQQNANGLLEEYSTRIRGVTIRPRVQVNCRIINSELKSCSQDMSRIEIDDEYCESVDYRGRPIGEYDEPDHILTCVGFWMEDMKSYLITYDEEDAISKFRCWVYERISWTEVSMSRSQTARCQINQDSSTYLLEGTGLNLILEENERLFDDCPQRFDPGINPYAKSKVIYVLSSAPCHSYSLLPAVLGFSILLAGLL